MITAGIDICDDYITVYSSASHGALRLPAVLARDRRSEQWYLGEEALRAALSGKAVMTDRLLSLLEKDGTSTVSRHCYTASELMGRMISEALKLSSQDGSDPAYDSLVITVEKPEPSLMEKLLKAASVTGISPSNIRLISHCEALISFVMAQDKSLYANCCAVFDLSDESLRYYELRVLRGNGRNAVSAASEDAGTAFRTDILSSEAGRKLADRIMTDAASRYMKNGIYSSVLLTGKGFQQTDWAHGFLSLICQRRKVMYHDGIFAEGAFLTPLAEEEEKQVYLCDTRLEYELSLRVEIKGRGSRLILASPGDRWFGRRVHADVLPLDQDHIDLIAEPADRNRRSRTIRIPVGSFPERPRGCTAVSLEVCFPGPDRLTVTASDLGFGELFPSSGKKVIEETQL